MEEPERKYIIEQGFPAMQIYCPGCHFSQVAWPIHVKFATKQSWQYSTNDYCSVACARQFHAKEFQKLDRQHAEKEQQPPTVKEPTVKKSVQKYW